MVLVFKRRVFLPLNRDPPSRDPTYRHLMVLQLTHQAITQVLPAGSRRKGLAPTMASRMARPLPLNEAATCERRHWPPSC